MLPLARLLLDYDLNLLHTIAGLWGVELTAPTQNEAAKELAELLLQPDLVTEVVEALPAEARAALDSLKPTGRQPLAQFTRQFGERRNLGAVRRDREQPWANAPTPTEMLWYRALIGQAFFDSGELGPQEFIFIPTDLQPRLPAAAAPGAVPPGAPAPAPAAFTGTAGLAADDAATLLAYLQIAAVRLEGAHLPAKHTDTLRPFLQLPEAAEFLAHLLIRLGFIGGAPLKPEPAQARPFLEATRAQQIEALAQAWRTSAEWNDLLHLPGLIFEGLGWHNDPLATRQAVLHQLAQVPPGEWWSLAAWVEACKDRQPDFQRPAGDYDSWYVREAATQTYLRGFEHWDQVDGALLRWLVQKPLHWLGLTDLSADATAFRLNPFGAAWLGLAEWPSAELPQPIHLSADGTFRLPASASRYDRFQAARICNWLPPQEHIYFYRLAPAALARAAKQGIKISHITAFLQKVVSPENLPPHILGALHRWERAGREAALAETLVLKLSSPELYDTLWRTPSIQPYLGERLSPTVVEIKHAGADADKLRAALAELGILTD